MGGEMEIKGKKNLIGKMWERCKSLGRSGGRDSKSPVQLRVTRKSKSWNGLEVCNNVDKGNNGRHVVPKGCFSVYVGAEKRKFVVRTEYANHPLFRVLLEQAEAEYGYNTCGPIELPCDVEIFYRVLKEMDDADDDSTLPWSLPTPVWVRRSICQPGCQTPSWMIAINQL